MKFKKVKTLNEAIAEVMEKDQGVVDPVYADAIRQSKNVRDLINKKFKERKIETPNEDRFAHTGKIKGTPEQKKMELTESLFTEWVEVDPDTDEELDNNYDEELEEEIQPDQKYPVKSPISEDIEETTPTNDATADSSSPLQFAEEPISLKNIIVKNDDKGDLVYVKEDGTQVELKGLEVEEVELTKDDLFTNQQTVNQEKLDNFIKSVDELPPVVVVMDDEGKYHILDGNHRSIAFIESGKGVPAYAYLLSEIEEKLAEEGITPEESKVATVDVKDGLTEQKWLTLKDMEITTPDNHIIKVAVTAPASVIMAVEKDDVNNGIDSGLYDRDGLILDDYFLMMESESGISSNKYADYLKAMGKNVDEDVQDCQKFPVDFKKSKVLNELTEDLDFDIRSDLYSEVYGVLEPITFKYRDKGASLRDIELACEHFIIRVVDIFDDNLDENLEDSQRYPIEKPKAKDSQYISAKDKQPTQHIEAKDSNYVSAKDKTPHLVEEIEDDKLEEASFKKGEGNKYFAKQKRGSLADVIQSTLTDGEWGYVKSPDGTITPTLLPHLSLAESEIGVDWDRNDNMYIEAPVKVNPMGQMVSEEDIIEVANRFHKEYKVETLYNGRKVVHIYVDEDKDFDGNYIGDDYPINMEGVKGRGTGKRGNPNTWKDAEDEDLNDENDENLDEALTPEQKYPIESPICESIEVNGIDLETYICNDKDAQELLDMIRDKGKLDQFAEMIEDQFLDSLTSESLEHSLIEEKDRWLDVLNLTKKDNNMEE